jgi:hypothetical protein
MINTHLEHKTYVIGGINKISVGPGARGSPRVRGRPPDVQNTIFVVVYFGMYFFLRTEGSIVGPCYAIWQ